MVARYKAVGARLIDYFERHGDAAGKEKVRAILEMAEITEQDPAEVMARLQALGSESLTQNPTQSGTAAGARRALQL
jgi:hypothetical protein